VAPSLIGRRNGVSGDRTASRPGRVQVPSERRYPVQNLMPVAWRAEGPSLPYTTVRYPGDPVLPRRWS
jgi:hypothetical protein